MISTRVLLETVLGVRVKTKAGIAVLVAIVSAGIWHLAQGTIALPEAPIARPVSREIARPGKAAPDAAAAWANLPSQTTPGKLAAEAGPGMFWKTVEVRAGVRALDIDESGRIWAASGGASVFHPGRPDAPEVFKAPTTGSVKGSAVDREGRFCATQWHGAPLICYERGRWETIPSPGEYLRAAGIFRGRIFAAAQVLKEWDPGRKRWTSVAETVGSVFDHFHATPWGAFLAGGPTLWVLNDPDGTGWRRLWSGKGGSEEWITSLDSDADGRIFAGTRNGFFVLERTGRVLAHRLPGRPVSGVAARSGERYWVSSLRDGLFFIDGNKESRFGYAEGLPSDEVSDLVVDREGYLWFANAGLQVARADEAEAVMRRPPSPPKMNGTVFPDACAAAAALIKGPRDSGQVAVETVEGKTVVFFNGRQACPDRHNGRVNTLNAFRRADGALAVMSYNGARFSNYCPRPCSAGEAKEMQKRWTGYLLLPLEKGGGLHRVDLPPVEPVPAETPNATFHLDARGRLWVGTTRDGLYMLNGREWTRFAQEASLHPDNAVSMMAEDASGNIWVASSPQFDRVKGKYPHSNLHRWDGKVWKHWSPEDGLAYWSTDYILPLSSGALVVSTNGGLSVLIGDTVRKLGGDRAATYYANSLTEDSRGRLWITNTYRATGVTLFDEPGFTTRDTRDGLFADRLRASAHDAQGRVWLLADDGRVAVYDPKLFESSARPVLAEREPGK